MRQQKSAPTTIGTLVGRVLRQPTRSPQLPARRSFTKRRLHALQTTTPTLSVESLRRDTRRETSTSSSKIVVRESHHSRGAGNQAIQCSRKIISMHLEPSVHRRAQTETAKRKPSPDVRHGPRLEGPRRSTSQRTSTGALWKFTDKIKTLNATGTVPAPEMVHPKEELRQTERGR